MPPRMPGRSWSPVCLTCVARMSNTRLVSVVVHTGGNLTEDAAYAMRPLGWVPVDVEESSCSEA